MGRINQLYSAFGSHFKIPFMKKYGMTNYLDKKQPVVMFGCYGSQIRVALENKAHARIIWAGSDCWNFIKTGEYVEEVKNAPHIDHVAISKFIEDDLKSVGIPCRLIPIVPMDNSDIQPKPLGSGIYVYKPGAYNPGMIRRIKKALPEFKFIETYHNAYSRNELLKLYGDSFMGLRFTNHDGMANTAIELGLMGRKIIWNGNTPNAIPFDLHDFEKIIRDIRHEWKNRHTSEYLQTAQKVSEFINIGDGFLYID